MRFGFGPGCLEDCGGVNLHPRSSHDFLSQEKVPGTEKPLLPKRFLAPLLCLGLPASLGKQKSDLNGLSSLLRKTSFELQRSPAN